MWYDIGAEMRTHSLDNYVLGDRTRPTHTVGGFISSVVSEKLVLSFLEIGLRVDSSYIIGQIFNPEGTTTTSRTSLKKTADLESKSGETPKLGVRLVRSYSKPSNNPTWDEFNSTVNHSPLAANENSYEHGYPKKSLQKKSNIVNIRPEITTQKTLRFIKSGSVGGRGLYKPHSWDRFKFKES